MDNAGMMGQISFSSQYAYSVQKFESKFKSWSVQGYHTLLSELANNTLYRVCQKTYSGLL